MTPFQVIPISNVNIRSGPGESFDIINKALSGTRLRASESQKDGGGNTWYKVTDDGWVNSKYVKQQNQLESQGKLRAFSLSGAASGLIQNVVSGSSGLKIGDVNLGVLGSLTGITSQSSQSVILTRRIYGTPYQFLDSTDMRPDDGPLGLQFCNNIMSETPILSILPGVPNYLADLSKEDKLAKTKALTEILTSAVKDIQEMATEKLSTDPELDTKFFSFQSKTAEYMLYVNLLCRMCAIYLGVGESTVPGTTQKYAEFNWFNWHLSNAYANKSTTVGGAAEAVENVKKFINDNSNITEYAKKLKDQYNANSATGYGKIASSMNGISDEVSNNYYYQDTYYIDFFIKPPSYSESFSNSTGDSAFAGTIQGASNLQKELAFLFSGSGLGNANIISENSESFKEYMDKWIETNIHSETTRKLMSRLVTGSTSVLSGANLVFPEIWNSSSYNRDFQVDMVFKTPYGDRESIFLNVMVPYMHALALVLPRQATVNSYTSPFLVRATVPGFFSCDMGIVKDMQVTKGGDSGDCWSAEGLPTEIRISMGIQDLYNSLAMSNFKTAKNIYNFLYNTALLDFIGVQCGLSMKTSEWQKKLNLVKALTANIPSDALDYIQTAAREEVAMSKAKILAAK